MNPPPQAPAASSGWILLAGLLLGGGLLVFMAWDAFSSRKPNAPVSAHVIELTEDNWQQEVVDSKVPVLVDFTAEWCVYCKHQAPIVAKIAKDFGSKIKVGTVDLDKNPELKAKYQVGGIPHILIMNGGDQPLASLPGLQQEGRLVRELEAALKKR